MEKDIKVSIILPTYNGAKYISRAIDSVISQNFSDWELIIIDDGSSDNTKDVLSHYLENKKIKYLYQNNQGPSIARNKAILIAKGTYLSFIDDDDLWEKDKLLKQVEFLDNNMDYVLVGTGAVILDGNGIEIMRYLLPEADNSIRNKILFKNCFMQSSVLVRKDTYFLSGGYPNVEHLYAEDYDLWLRIGLLGKMFNIPDFLIKYTIRDGNLSSLNRGKILKNNIKMINKYGEKYKGLVLALVFGYLKIIFYCIFDLIPSSFKNKIFKFYKEF